MASNTSHDQAPMSSLYSLAGYLELLQTKLLRTTHKKYWFWFDEMTCSLKYYRNQEIYAVGVNEPLGTIDLSYAKVTPGITANSNSNTFIINVSGHVYKLCAGTSNEALTWVEKLQEKRGEFIKVNDMRKKTASDLEKDRRTLRPLASNPVGQLATQQSSETVPQKSPPNVRKIVNKTIGHRSSLNIETGMFSAPADLTLRRSTIDAMIHTHDASPPPSLEQNPESPMEDIDPSSLGYVEVDGVENSDTCTDTCTLSPLSRRVLELEAMTLKQQKEISNLQKEKLKLEEKVQVRDDAINSLNLELSKVKEKLAENKKPHSELKSEIASLKNIIDQYKRSLTSLDNEIELHKQSKETHIKEINVEKQRVLDMERELNIVKSKYVQLLNAQFKIHIPNLTRGQDDEDPELLKHTEELLALTAQEGGDQQNYRGSFEDDLGDIHDWQNDALTQRYLCRLLYLHYKQNEVDAIAKEWEDYLVQVRRSRKPYLEFLPSNDRSKKNELRALLRKGIPMQYRKMVWTGLVFRLVGKVKEHRDAASEHGSYYWSLVNSSTKSGMEKQIKIDLHRTLPNNKYFKLDGVGIPKLETVLLAFSRHDKNIGYCQSMNMIAALGLLFLDEETAFWLLVAVIEKLLPPNYYSVDLAGVQADQRVMGGLMSDKLPRLSAHLENFGIDVALITLNWFMTIFIDAMPTKSALRIMDCFLLEGVKFLFKASLSVFGLYQTSILQLQDQLVLLQYCKEIPKHIFDMETLFQEFNRLNPFPKSSVLQSKHNVHLAKINEQLTHKSKRRKQRAAAEKQQANVSVLSTPLISPEIPPVSPVQPVNQRIVWECGCVCASGYGQEEVWLCGGEGRLGVVSSVEGTIDLHIHDTQLSPRVICAQYVSEHDIVLIGTLDLQLIAFDYTTKATKWNHTLNDSVLAITVSKKGVVFVALADGFLAVLQDVSPDSTPVLVRVGSTAVSSMILVGGYLWCGCGKAITVLCTELLEPVESLVLGEGRVNKLVFDGAVGVWVSFRQSSLLTLYHASLYVPLLSIDLLTFLPPHLLNPDIDKEIFKSSFRITSMMLCGGRLWVGTGGGRVLIFSYEHNPEVDVDTAVAALVDRRKQIRETTLQNLESQEGGLLGSTVVGKAKEVEPKNEPLIEKREVKDNVLESSQRRHKKTRFGRTLRNNKVLKQSKTREQPDVFILRLENCSDTLTGPNDSVRILLSLQCGEEVLAISCVNPVKSEWQNGVQLWTCSKDIPPSEWRHKFLTV